MTNEYKTEINNIFKIFINSFEKKEKIKNNFSNSLQKHLNNFTKEYYNNYNKIFKNSLEENLNAILNKYNNDTSIENINLIVIRSWKKHINKPNINFGRKQKSN